MMFIFVFLNVHDTHFKLEVINLYAKLRVSKIRQSKSYVKIVDFEIIVFSKKCSIVNLE